MLSNSAQRWGSLSKALHWAMALLILIEVPVGFVMAYTYGPSFRDADVRALHVTLAQVHHTNGFLILLLVGLRLLWRIRQPVPDLPLHVYQRALARLTHGIFYGLLILIPLSGWMAISVLGDTERFGETPLWLFGWDVVPPIAPQRPLDDPFGYGFVASIHRYAIYAGGGLLALHVLAALWHHLVSRDGILLRMWPGTRGREA